MPRLRNAANCNKSVGLALDWLKAKCGDADDWRTSPYPLSTYHKVPYLLALGGFQEECRRALLWIWENLAAPNGDLRASPIKPDVPAGTETPCAAVREKSWVAMAAHIAGRFDISLPLANFLASRQGRSTGGVYGVDFSGMPSPTAGTRATACAGQVFLFCGMLREARLAGRFLENLLHAQPEEERFFLRMSDDGKLITRFNRSGADLHVIGRTTRHTQISSLAMPAIFLCQLHLATQEAEWREAALDYYAVAFGCDESASLDKLEDSSYLGWAAATLYGISRRRVYYDAAEQITQSWIDRQESDGSWRAKGAKRQDEPTITLTAQTALCIAEAVREAQ